MRLFPGPKSSTRQEPYVCMYVCTTENFEMNSNSGQGLGDGKANKDWRYKSHLSAKP